MKNILLIIASLLLLSNFSNAQKWSAGYRTGLEQMEPRLSNKPFGKENILWNNQLFLNRAIVGNLEGEINLTYNHRSKTDSLSYFDGPYLAIENSKVTQVTLGLNLRYPVLSGSRWGAFVQAGATAYKSWLSLSGVSYLEPGSTAKSYSGKGSSSVTVLNTITAGTGVNYALNKYFYLNSLFNIIYRPNGRFLYMGQPYNRTNFSLALYVGVGFRF